MKYTFLIMTFLWLINSGCKPCIGCNDPIPANPGALFLSIKLNGQPYPDSLMKGVQLFYYYNGKKITNPNDDPNGIMGKNPVDTLLIFRTPNDSNGALIPGEFTSIYLLDAVIYSHVNDFYLKFPNGDIDTVNITAKGVASDDANTVPCRCMRQILSVSLNGKNTQSIPKAYSNATYILEK